MPDISEMNIKSSAREEVKKMFDPAPSTSPMTADRTIGRTVEDKTYQALVELLPETSSYVKSSLAASTRSRHKQLRHPPGGKRARGRDRHEPRHGRRRRGQNAEPPDACHCAPPSHHVGQHDRNDHAGRDEKKFEYGVKRYPELDNPVGSRAKRTWTSSSEKPHEGMQGGSR